MGLIELHAHLGGSVPMRVMFKIAAERGMKLPVKDYFEFVEMLSARKETVHSLDEYLNVIHLCDRIQSSAQAVEWSTYEMVSDCYRNSNVDRLEIRFNPAKRNGEDELDLDRIILAAIHGMEKGTLEFRTEAGLIICLAREFSHNLNEILVEKAIKYKSRGVIGIDMAGPEKFCMNLPKLAALYFKAKSAGLGTTIHTGETDATGPDEVWAIANALTPDRIGHGVQCIKDNNTMDLLRREKITLELCPTSNVRTGAVAGPHKYRQLIEKLDNNGVRWTINTDATQMLKTTLQGEIDWLLNNEVCDPDQIEQAQKNALEVSFLK